jgi:hypothetical protein
MGLAWSIAMVIQTGPDRFEFALYVFELPIARDAIMPNQSVGDFGKPNALQPR